MWKTEYHERLFDWVALREHCDLKQSTEEKLTAINNWWFRAPIVNCTVRWNEAAFWPGPWELLLNSGYCDLARALGIVYTIMMLDEPINATVEIIEVENDNLVLIDSGKYILNWAPGEIVNTNSLQENISQRIDSSALERFIHQ